MAPFHSRTIGFGFVTETVINGQVAAEQPLAAGQGVSPDCIQNGRPLKNQNSNPIYENHHSLNLICLSNKLHHGYPYQQTLQSCQSYFVLTKIVILGDCSHVMPSQFLH